MSQAADESFGKYKTFTLKTKLKTWDGDIKLTVQQENLECKMFFQTKTIYNEIEYKRRTAITKREKSIANPENTMSHSESDIYRIKQKILKLLNHINKIIKESASINLVQVNKCFYIIIRDYGIKTLSKKMLGLKKMLTMEL